MKIKSTYRYYLIAVTTIVLLIVLAALQYSWLNEVEEAQKKRLIEQIQAGSEGFSTAFNQEFESINSRFQILSNPDDITVKSQLQKEYESWKEDSDFDALIESITLFTIEPTDGMYGYVYSPDENDLTVLSDSQIVVLKERVSDNILIKNGELYVNTEFVALGDPSYMFKPVWISKKRSNPASPFTFFTHTNERSFRWQLLIEFDQSVIKNELIPALTQTYFGDDYEDVFTIELVTSEIKNDSTFYTSNQLPDSEPEFSKAIGNIRQSKIVVVYSSNTGDDSTVVDIQFNRSTLNEVSKKPRLDSLTISVNSLSIDTDKFELNREFAFSDSNSNSSSSSSSSSIWSVGSQYPGALSSFSSSGLRQSMTSYQDEPQSRLNVYMKSGSLEQYVAQAKIQNLGISLAILLLLGGAIIFITRLGQKSETLANQQMMFMAGISHEIKTPVSVISSAAENIKDGVISTPERMTEYGKLILKESSRLSTLLNQVLNLAGIQTDQISIKQAHLDIQDVLSRLEDKLNPLLEDANMTLEISKPDDVQTVFADADALDQILGNIIHNAIKYRGTNSKVILHIEKSPGELIFKVKDYGPGIENADLKHLFEPFFRGKRATDQQISGNGLGLYLVNQLILRHGGTIKVNSALDVGTTFTLTFPNHHSDE